MSKEVKRRRNESFEGMMRRVKKEWKMSGRILQARKVKFVQPKKSKNVQKNATVTSIQKKSKEAYLRKIGRLPQEDPRGRGGRRRR